MENKHEEKLYELKKLLVRAGTGDVSFHTFNFRCNVFLNDLKKDEEKNKKFISQIDDMKAIAEKWEEKIFIPNGRSMFFTRQKAVGILKTRGYITAEQEIEMLEQKSQKQPE